MEDKNKVDLIEQLKDLNDYEFEILFVDSIYKSIKVNVNNTLSRTHGLLFLLYSVVESYKKYKSYANDSNRTVPHEDVVDLIINKCDNYLSSVDEANSVYISKVLNDILDLTKALLLTLKSEIVEFDEYKYLKQNT